MIKAVMNQSGHIVSQDWDSKVILQMHLQGLALQWLSYVTFPETNP